MFNDLKMRREQRLVVDGILGALAVALRCALLEDNKATLFAGAGILRESDPQQEYLETEWKLRSMLEALQNG